MAAARVRFHKNGRGTEKMKVPANNNHRAGRINEDVKREMAVILNEVKDPRIPAFPTVVSVKVSPDQAYATIFVSFLADYDEKEVMKGLKAATGYIKKRLASNLRLRVVPDITFVFDHSIEHGAKIDSILKDIM